MSPEPLASLEPSGEKLTASTASAWPAREAEQRQTALARKEACGRYWTQTAPSTDLLAAERRAPRLSRAAGGGLAFLLLFFFAAAARASSSSAAEEAGSSCSSPSTKKAYGSASAVPLGVPLRSLTRAASCCWVTVEGTSSCGPVVVVEFFFPVRFRLLRLRGERAASIDEKTSLSLFLLPSFSLVFCSKTVRTHT